MDNYKRFFAVCSRIVVSILLFIACAHHLNALDLALLSSKFPTKPNTLSFAYLKDSSLRYKAEVQYDTTPTQDALIEQILQKEAELTNAGYFVIYHAHNGALYILHELYKQLYCHIHHCARPLRFEFLRSPLQELSNQSAEAFLKQHKYNINDNYEPYQSQLLSVNVSLFGNTWKWGESSLKLFLQNRSLCPPLIISNALENLCKLRKRNFDEELRISECIQQLCEKIQEHPSLMQIAIPRHLISQLCYSCSVRGVPKSFSKKLEYLTPYTANPKPYLENLVSYFDWLSQEQEYENYTSYFPTFSQEISRMEEIDHIQMRVLIQPNGMGNPKSGIVILRYTTLPEQEKKHIQQALSKLL